MDREFSISTGYKIFYGIMALFIIGMGLFFFSLSPAKTPFLYVFAFMLIVLGIVLGLYKFKSNISIYQDRLTQTSLFKTKAISLTDIKGFRIETKLLYVESVSSAKITLRSYTEYADYEELVQWLRENYKDLDSVDYQADLQRVLTDTSLGYTEQDREAALKKAKLTAWSFNIIGVVLLGISFLNKIVFQAKHNQVLDVILLLYPILGVFVLFTGKGLIRLYITKRSPFYSIYIGMFSVLMALFIKSIADYHILQLTHFWLPFLVVGIAFCIALKFTDREQTATTMGMASIFLFLGAGLIYAFCSVRVVNCSFDNSAEKVFPAVVLNHNISHNKGTHYHLTIGAWGPQTKTENIDVSEREFFQDTIGSTVSVHLKKGVLNIPWYSISM